MTKKEMWAEIVELGLGELTVEMHLEVSCSIGPILKGDGLLDS